MKLTKCYVLVVSIPEMNTFTQVNEGIAVFSQRASGTSKSGESAQGAGLPTCADGCVDDGYREAAKNEETW